MRLVRAGIVAVGVVGSAVFGVVLAVSFVRPVWVETVAKGMVRRQAEKEIVATMSSFVSPERVRAAVAEMQNADCPCRRFMAGALTAMLESESAVKIGFAGLVRTNYRKVTRALLREVRIFAGANLLVFLLLGATALLRRRAGLQLLLPAFVLLAPRLSRCSTSSARTGCRRSSSTITSASPTSAISPRRWRVSGTSSSTGLG